MKFVNCIRRIIAIDKAIAKAPNEERYDDIVDRLFDKRDMLVKSLKEYKHCADRTDREQRKASYQKRKQIMLACKLLGVEYYYIMRLF